MLLKHNLALVVDDVTVLVDQVALNIDQTALLVSVLTGRVLFQNWSSVLVSVKVTLNTLDVKLSERENLRELSVLQVGALPDLSLISINDVTLFVDEISFFVNSTSKIVEQLAGTIVLGDDVTVLILIELAHHVLDVEALSIVIEKLVEIVVIQLALIKLLTALFVYDVALAW